MRFNAFKVFHRGQDVANYLSQDLPRTLRNLQFGLTKIAFQDNFESFQVEVVIPASSEIGIDNQARFIPTRRLIVRQTGGGAITDGDTDWTSDTLYLKNTGGTDATVTVVFLR